MTVRLPLYTPTDPLQKLSEFSGIGRFVLRGCSDNITVFEGHIKGKQNFWLTSNIDLIYKSPSTFVVFPLDEK